MASPEKFIKRISSGILNKNDLDQMLSTRNVEEALDRIAYKPIGFILRREIESKRFNLENLFKVIFRYYLDKRKELRSKAGPYVEVLNTFDDVFDAINIMAYVLAKRETRRLTVPVPFGNFASLLYEYEDEVEKFLTGDLGVKYKAIYSRNTGGYIELFNVIKTKLPAEFMLDYNLKKTYGFLRDSILLRTCISCIEEPPSASLLLSMMRDQFYNICKVKDLKELPHVFKGVNPIYDVFSDALQDTFKLHVGLETFDLALFLTIHYLAQSLNQNINQLVAKAYLLLLTESVITRLALSSLETKLYIDEVKNLVNKWWF